MTDVLLLHHAQGKTGGVVALAERLRGEGHTVHVPDLFDGRTFDSLQDGLDFAAGIGFDRIREQGVQAADGLPDPLVVVGLSMGVMAAAQLAEQRPGLAGAVFVSAAVPPQEEGGAWPDAVPLQIHGAQDDPVFTDEGDLEVARSLVDAAPDAELFLYPVEAHLFMDSTLPGYSEVETETLVARVLRLLDRVA